MTYKVKGQGHKVTRSVRVGPIAYKSKTNSRSITKIGIRVPHDTCYIAHQFQGQKVKVTGQLMQTHKMSRIFQTVKPENFKVGVWIEDVDPHQRQVPWPPRSKVKVISSHRLYISSLPLLSSGETLVSLEAGGGIPCWPNPAATLLVHTNLYPIRLKLTEKKWLKKKLTDDDDGWQRTR